MKKLILLLAVLISARAFPQSKLYLRGDSVFIQRDGGNGELILRNSTRGIIGALFNIGNGVTRFQAIVPGNDSAYVNAIQLNDSTLIFIRDNNGQDTLVFHGASTPQLNLTAGTNISLTGTSPNITINATTGDSTGQAAWKLTGNPGVTNANFLGSTNNASLRFRTNNTEKMVLDSNGRVGINTILPAAFLDVRKDNIAAASPDSSMGVYIHNDQPSTISVPVQNSAALTLTGRAWNTTAATDGFIRFRLWVQGASSPTATGNMLLQSSINNGAYSTHTTFQANGNVVTGGITCGVLNSGAIVSTSNIQGAGNLAISGVAFNSTITNGLGIGSTTMANMDSSTILNIGSTTRGLLIPVMTNTQMNAIIGGLGTPTLAPGSGQTNTTYPAKALTGGSGSGATASITVAGGIVTSITTVFPVGSGYVNGDVLSASGMGGTPFTWTLTNVKKPATGLMIYNTTLKRVCQYDGTSWQTPEYTSTGTAAPATTPLAIGDKFVDSTNKKIYFATGTASSADWTIVN